MNIQNNTDMNLVMEEVGGLLQIADNVINNGSVNKNTGAWSDTRSVEMPLIVFHALITHQPCLMVETLLIHQVASVLLQN